MKLALFIKKLLAIITLLLFGGQGLIALPNNSLNPEDILLNEINEKINLNALDESAEKKLIDKMHSIFFNRKYEDGEVVWQASLKLRENIKNQWPDITAQDYKKNGFSVGNVLLANLNKKKSHTSQDLEKIVNVLIRENNCISEEADITLFLILINDDQRFKPYFSKIIENYKQLIDKGCKLAKRNYGNIKLLGLGGTKRNVNEAINLLHGVKLGDLDLAEYFFYKKDDENCKKYLKFAKLNVNDESYLKQIELLEINKKHITPNVFIKLEFAILLLDSPLPLDHTRALEILKEIIKLKDEFGKIYAYRLMGHCYILGKGVNQSNEIASDYNKKAKALTDKLFPNNNFSWIYSPTYL